MSRQFDSFCRRTFCATLFFILSFIFTVEIYAFLGFGNPLDGDTKDRIENEMVNRSIRIVPQLNNMTSGYGVSGAVEYYYIKTIDKIFLQKNGIEVNVVDVDFESDGLTLELFNEILGNGKIRYFFDESQLKSLNALSICDALISVLSDERHSKVYCNKDTKFVTTQRNFQFYYSLQKELRQFSIEQAL